jgi:hypothetical protein
LNSSDRERKSQLRAISTTKTNSFGVNGFQLIEKVYTRYVFSLNMPEMIDLNPNNFYFKLIVSYRANLWLLEAIDMF